MGLHHDILKDIAAPYHFSTEVGATETVVIHAVPASLVGIGGGVIGGTFVVGGSVNADGSTEVTGELIVQLPTMFSDQNYGESQVVTGQALFPEAIESLANVKNTITIRGEKWQIRAVGTLIDGFKATQIVRRRHETQTASNSLGGL